MPAWLISLISAVTGAVASVLVQFLALRIGDRYKRHKMRMVLYGELSMVAAMLKSVLDHSEQVLKIKHILVDDRALLSPLLGLKYIESDLDIFVQLPEHITIHSLYRQVEVILQEPKSANEGIRSFLRLVAEFAGNRTLRKKYMKGFRTEMVDKPFAGPANG